MKAMMAFFDWLADHKGVPVILGIVLIVTNFLVILFAPEAWAAQTHFLLHVGLVIGLLGELLAEVL